jgi:hypothetical protein
MSDIGQIIVDQIKKYASSDAQFGFYYDNTFESPIFMVQCLLIPVCILFVEWMS